MRVNKMSEENLNPVVQMLVSPLKDLVNFRKCELQLVRVVDRKQSKGVVALDPARSKPFSDIKVDFESKFKANHARPPPGIGRSFEFFALGKQRHDRLFGLDALYDPDLVRSSWDVDAAGTRTWLETSGKLKTIVIR